MLPIGDQAAGVFLNPEGNFLFARWRDDGTWQRILYALRQTVRTAAGKEPNPSAGSIDSQTVKGSEVGGERGYDGARRPGASCVTSLWTP